MPEGAAADRCEAIADRLAALDEERDSEECGDLDALEDEYERLNEEYEALTTGWSPDDLARSGVLAYWDRGRIETVEGLVRPEERETSGKPGTSGATGGTEPVSESAESDTLVLSEFSSPTC